MSALLDSLLAGAPADASLARAAALREVRTLGLPAARTESWKYTSLRALERRSFARPAPVSVEAGAVALPPAPRLVFVNGQVDSRHSEPLPAGVTLEPLSLALAAGDAQALRALERRYERADEGFARLNAGLAQEGVHLHVPAGVDGGTIHLVFLGAPAPDAAWHLRHVVTLEAGAALTIVEHRHATGAHAHFANEIAQLSLAPSSRLTHLRLQSEDDGASALLRTDAVLAAGARYRRLDLELGAAWSRHELNVELAGAGAALQANGVLLAGGRRHLDTRLCIEHAARDTRSDLTWRAIGAGRGRGVFHGGILIHAGADGSEAQLANKNLLLSEGAEIDTQPVLEIHADEVKAAHGATVGQLNDAALFYLRSRGIPQAQARALLTTAFAREVLDAVAPAELAPALADALERALAAVTAA